MDADMSRNQSCCSSMVQSTDSDALDSAIKRKKLNVPNDLLNDIDRFKDTMTEQNNQHQISGPTNDGAQREWPGSVVELMRHSDELRRLNAARERHVAELRLFLADEDCVIAALRAEIEAAHGVYESLRRRFQQTFTTTDNDKAASEAAAAQEAAASDETEAAAEAAAAAAAVAAAAAAATDDEQCRAIGDALLGDIRSLERLERELADDGKPASAEQLAELARALEAAGLANNPDSAAGGMRSVALWRAVTALYGNNRELAATADSLDLQTVRLEEELKRAAAGRAVAGADRADKTAESAALDEFCAVTGRMKAHQEQNLQFGLTLAVDDRTIAEEQAKIERLKAKIGRKQTKRENLVQETAGVKSRLEAAKLRFEELNRTRDQLIGDVNAAGRLSTVRAIRPEQQQQQQCFGQRAKHLKHLKIQYNQLTNTRDALKLKLQRYTQGLEVKIAQPTNPSVNKD